MIARILFTTSQLQICPHYWLCGNWGLSYKHFFYSCVMFSPMRRGCHRVNCLLTQAAVSCLPALVRLHLRGVSSAYSMTAKQKARRVFSKKSDQSFNHWKRPKTTGIWGSSLWDPLRWLYNEVHSWQTPLMHSVSKLLFISDFYLWADNQRL